MEKCVFSREGIGRAGNNNIAKHSNLLMSKE
jgi:hypothetical protein